MCNVCRGDRGRMQGKNTHAYGIFYKHLLINSTPKDFGDGVWLTDTIICIILSILKKKKNLLEKPALVLCLKTEAELASGTSRYLKHLDNGQRPKKIWCQWLIN